MIVVRGWTGERMRTVAQGLRDGLTVTEIAAAAGRTRDHVHYAVRILRRFYPDLPAPGHGPQCEWTEAENAAIARILERFPHRTVDELLNVLCDAASRRSRGGVRGQAKRLSQRMPCRRRKAPLWTAEEEAALRAGWRPGVTLPGRSAEACRQHGERVMGLSAKRWRKAGPGRTDEGRAA